MGGLSLELCFSNVRSCFTHGKVNGSVFMKILFFLAVVYYCSLPKFFAFRLQRHQKMNGMEKN